MELEQLYEERDKPPDASLWRWSPLELTEFDRMLQVARSLAAAMNVRLHRPGGGMRRISIAEAGSGIGTKLYLAKNYYDMAETGYEINPGYLAKSKELEVNAVECDLRDADIPWAMYDIVYLSRPFKSDESDTVNPDQVEIAWERSVMEAMRNGAVLISAYAAVKPKWPCYYRRPFRGVWLKDPDGLYAK